MMALSRYICIGINIIGLYILWVVTNTDNGSRSYDGHISYDYIVIGSGTGGVIASRLAQSGHSVLLIEAGPNDDTYSCNNCDAYPYGDLKRGTINTVQTEWWFKEVKALQWHNVSAMPSYWDYNHTILHRRESVYRAKMLGGCLSHNGHAWMRGDMRDYDFVSKHNNLPDWSFNNVLPYFQRIETYVGENKSMRGTHGPITIRQRNIQSFEHKLKALFDTAINYGLPYNNHQNGVGSQYGIAIGEANIGKYEHGKRGLFNTTHYRESSSQSYIRKLGLKTGLLTVWHNTTVQKILFDSNAIPNAIGVQYWDKNNGNALKSVYCNKEIIVSAGLYQSPQLLILSGIGPLQQLQKWNIEPRIINEHIGKNGQDHVILKNWKYKVRLNMLNTSVKYPKGVLINQYFFGQTKERWESNPFHIKGRLELVLSSNKHDRLGYDYNDIRLSCFDGLYPKSNEIFCYLDAAVYSHNLSVDLQSNDSRQYPNVYNEYFSDSRDYDTIVAGIKKLRNIFAHNKSLFFKEVYPGTDKTDQQLRELIFNDASTSIHGVGTLSMGDGDDTDSDQFPVTSKCKLRLADKLRIADASIWPYSVNGGTQALVFMIGEKCAQHIIDDSNEINYRYFARFIVIFATLLFVLSVSNIRILFVLSTATLTLNWLFLINYNWEDSISISTPEMTIMHSTKEGKLNIDKYAQCAKMVNEFTIDFITNATQSGLRHNYPIWLLSYGGSGNSMTRILLEYTTNIYTGSIYHDAHVQNLGFEGEQTCMNVTVVKAHSEHIRPARMRKSETFRKECMEYEKKIGTKPVLWTNASAIVLIRNPWKAMFSTYQYLYGDEAVESPHVQHKMLCNWNGTEFAEHIASSVSAYLNTFKVMQKFDKYKYGYIIIQYEKLVSTGNGQSGVQELSKILEYLYTNEYYDEIKKTLLDKMDCIFNTLMQSDYERLGSMHRKKANATIHVTFDSAYQYLIDNHLNIVCHAWSQIKEVIHTSYGYGIVLNAEC